MAPSSSGSWDGGADIINLDKYMRGSVRPSRALSEETQQCEQLVVDCGKPSVNITTRYKHYSNDSGVSDSSYRQRRTRRHRRANPTSPPATYREQASPQSPRSPQKSSDSLRQFRTVCEQVLIDQQKQIARVAEVCERLERKENERTNEDQSSPQPTDLNSKDYAPDRRIEKDDRVDQTIDKSKKGKNIPDKKKMEVIESRQSTETSDLSSSTSRSSDTRDLRRPDRHRVSYTEECKTYKIIMRKLDELNRHFGPQQRARAAHRPPSSSSVSVCDKLVATDPERIATVLTLTKTQRDINSQRAKDINQMHPCCAGTGTQDFSVILPREGLRKPLSPSNSVKYESSSACSVVEEHPSPGFDLEDPMPMYTQAKQFQGIAETRRAHSVDVNYRQRQRIEVEQQPIASVRSKSRSERTNERARERIRECSPSWCAVCRAYWKSLRQCLIAPLSDFKVN